MGVKVPCCTTLRVLHDHGQLPCMRAPLYIRVLHDHGQLPCMRAPLYVSSTTTASSHGCTMHSTCPPRPRPAPMGTLRVLHDHGQLPWALYVSSTTTASSHGCTMHSTCPPRPRPAPMGAPCTLRVLHDHGQLPYHMRAPLYVSPQPAPMRAVVKCRLYSPGWVFTCWT